MVIMVVVLLWDGRGDSRQFWAIGSSSPGLRGNCCVYYLTKRLDWVACGLGCLQAKESLFHNDWKILSLFCHGQQIAIAVSLIGRDLGESDYIFELLLGKTVAIALPCKSPIIQSRQGFSWRNRREIC
ncbi:hypothetical protein [Oscillatoria sp. HE19RPO]|uniref:hypothetical protein n=1 Tax=Oscillatoria sp. HE19RPO TaxID=2954806 RepID=UPI0020C493B6|nr:hypothetical protein [Oscillatoria sp. HE19RPO]